MKREEEGSITVEQVQCMCGGREGGVEGVEAKAVRGEVRGKVREKKEERVKQRRILRSKKTERERKRA